MTRKSKEATGKDINLLFVALARTAGIDSYYVLLSGRNEQFFNQKRMNTRELNANAVLVKLNQIGTVTETLRAIQLTHALLDAIKAKHPKELFINPGAESDALIARAEGLGLDPIQACSIVDSGERP